MKATVRPLRFQELTSVKTDQDWACQNSKKENPNTSRPRGVVKSRDGCYVTLEILTGLGDGSEWQHLSCKMAALTATPSIEASTVAGSRAPSRAKWIRPMRRCKIFNLLK